MSKLRFVLTKMGAPVCMVLARHSSCVSVQPHQHRNVVSLVVRWIGIAADKRCRSIKLTAPRLVPDPLASVHGAEAAEAASFTLWIEERSEYHTKFPGSSERNVYVVAFG